MQPSRARFMLALLLVLLTTGLGACGQKGPLVPRTPNTLAAGHH